MSELPTGTVTFLFTDIEGSTTLWEQHRDAMRQALVRHDALVEQIVAEHQGHVVRPRGEGDSRFAVFARATDAVAAAAALQQALYVEPWPTPTPLCVRMALHTGEADLRAGDYYGNAVNRCARLRAVAHGGQTLVSLATEQVIRGQLGTGVGLHDLGQHRLKDLQHSERVFQLIIDGVPADFAPLKTLDARPNNLPIQRDPLIGREREVAEVMELLRRPNVGLVTMIGPGGVGKTRLSLQVAAELLENFADGVWFVDLAPISDPTLIASTIAHSLGIKDVPGQSIAETLTASLRQRHLLLVLDNFEQVIVAAPLVADLLQAAPRLKALVTSRTVLHVYGEQEYPVLPLALPNLRHLPELDALQSSPATRLFVQRAQAVRPDFQVTPANAAAVAEICVRLEGLPLAIELAAARIKLFPPPALLRRLDQRLTTLTGGPRNLPARQQTLRGAIEWSSRLLNPAEQTLFARLSVFVGGWTIEAAEAVCAETREGAAEVIDGLASLADQSLVRQQEDRHGEPRFRMLETIREYAVERLEASGEAGVLQGHHARFFLALAEVAAPNLRSPFRARWLERLEAEHDNLRAALAWALGHAEPVLALRLATALGEFWLRRGHLREGRQWLERTLTSTGQGLAAGPALQATALLATGLIAHSQGDAQREEALAHEALTVFRALGDTPGSAAALAALAQARLYQSDFRQAAALFAEQLALERELGNQRGIASATGYLGYITCDQGEAVRGFRLLEESLAMHRTLGDPAAIAWALHSLGVAAYHQGDFARARAWCAESLALFQELGDVAHSGSMLIHLGSSAGYEGDFAQAGQLLAEGLALFRDLGDSRSVAVTLRYQGKVAQDKAAWPQAVALYQESVALAQAVGDRWEVAACLEGLAGVASGQERHAHAACLWGAAEAIRDQLGAPLPPAERALCDGCGADAGDGGRNSCDRRVGGGQGDDAGAGDRLCPGGR